MGCRARLLVTFIITAFATGCGPGGDPDRGTGSDGGVDMAPDARDGDSGTERRDAGVEDGGVDGGDEVDDDGIDDPPVAQDDQLTAVRGGTVTLDVLANDVEPDGETLTITEVTTPQRGAVSVDGGMLRFTASSIGETVSFSYTIADPGGATDEATVHVTPYEAPAEGAPLVFLPETGLRPEQLVVVIDESNPDSVAIGEHYAEARRLPAENVIRVSLPTDDAVMSPEDFQTTYAEIEAQLPGDTQAFALAWIAPYRVNCMSITTAFAVGRFDDAFCNTSGSPCARTQFVSYYDSDSITPWEDHQLRPTMMLATTSVDDGIALIDRGAEADGTFPPGVGHLVRTTDDRRSVRWPDFSGLPDEWSSPGAMELIYTDNSDGSGSNLITDTDDMMFYFTGLTSVSDLDTNTYRPGAVADHLTSFGGRLTSTGGQMSAVRWLEGGVTASYGTVVEPCNYEQKFPRVSVLLRHYFRGNSVVEAYWKSVSWPGEGAFIGDPLARPWGGGRMTWDAGTLTIDTTAFAPGETYVLSAADSIDGPFEPVHEGLQVDASQTVSIVEDNASQPVYRLATAP